LGGIHLSYGILKQLPVLPPDAFSPDDVAYLSERVLELVYTAWDIKAFADDVWAELDAAGRDRVRARWAASHGTPAPAGDAAPPPFRWDEERRAQIRAEIDARIARLYGLTRDELRYILDPADVYGPDFPGETFRVLKEKEIKHYGEYRTRRLVLAAWDAAEAPHAGAAPRRLADQDGSGAAPMARPAAPAGAPVAARRSGPAAAPPGWQPGDRVRHAALGEGRVTAVAPQDGDVEITVQFQTGGPRRLRASLARLERI
jgi:hypothetical protein